jgi:hypothetical protein
VITPKSSLPEIQLGTTSLDKEASAGCVKVTGSKEKVDELLGLLVKFNPDTGNCRSTALRPL